ncbi:MAG: translation initiation factor IF-2 subunit alpha [Candidatus Lokiarchaeota archaeon]|nr:translation initiation factor IF-2 subunit alpha [Candidatus Lokiarchaeota archaeon]
MSLKKKEWPEIGEFVIGTVVRVERHGAYVELEEYEGKEGLIHVSEVASSWVRNIRRFVREKQKVVAKVLRVNAKKRHIDLSLRRVSSQIKKIKIQEWKQHQKEDNLIRMIQESMAETGEEVTEEEIESEVVVKFSKKYDDILSGFSELKEKKEKVLKTLKIPEKWHSTLLKLAKSHIESPSIKVSGVLTLKSYENDGIDIIKQALLEAKVATENIRDVEAEVFLIGAPKYRLDIIAKDYQKANDIINNAAEVAKKVLIETGGDASFEILEEQKTLKKGKYSRR